MEDSGHRDNEAVDEETANPTELEQEIAEILTEVESTITAAAESKEETKPKEEPPKPKPVAADSFYRFM